MNPNFTTPLRLLTAVSLLIILALPISAQEKEDSVFTFRFLPENNMFYAPGLNNGAELARLFESVNRCKDSIMSHELYLHVDGFYNASGKKSDKYPTARTRSNRVKSELITRKGLRENCFITRNHAATSNYVTVRIRPRDWTPSEPLDLQPDTVVTAQTVVEDTTQNHQSEEPLLVADTVEIVECPDMGNPPVQPEIEEVSDQSADSRFALKTNLLDYAVLMPNVEGEWKFSDRWSVALEFQTAWYALKKSPRKIYRVGTIIPEIRYWVINHSRWNGMYVGAFAGVGKYDFDGFFGHRGHEGEGALAGLSVGYMWPISKHLSLDAGIGVGYLRIRDKEYLPAGGHYLYQLTKNIDYVGPLRLKLSLVWRIPSK